MQKRIKVGYIEQSKAVVASTTVEYIDETGEKIINEDVLKEAWDVFKQAQKKSQQESVRKSL